MRKSAYEGYIVPNEKEKKLEARRVLAYARRNRAEQKTFNRKFGRYNLRRGVKNTVKKLPIGTRVYLAAYRSKGTKTDEPFLKPSTRKNNVWDTSQEYSISKVYRQIPKSSGIYSEPVFVYELRFANRMDKKLAGVFYRNEMLVVRGPNDKNYYKNRREYIRKFIEPYNIELNPEEDSLKRQQNNNDDVGQ